MRWALVLLLATSCASTVPQFPETPHDVLSGKPRAIVNLPSLRRGEPTVFGFMLVGHPSRFKHNTYKATLSLLTFPDQIDSTYLWVNPAVSRYYSVMLNGLFVRRLTGSIAYAHLEICPLVGYNILGSPQLGPPFIRVAIPVSISDIVAGDPRDRYSSRDSRPTGPVSTPGCVQLSGGC